MPFNPNIPVNGTPNDADPIRENFNDLKAQTDDLQDQLDNLPPPIPGPQGPPGPAGADGATGPQGPAGDFTLPVTQTAVFDAPVHLGTQELKFDTTRDIGGSAEALAGISAVDSGSGPLLQIRCRGGGNDKSLVRLDPTGIQDGAGNPTVQDGDILQYRASDQTIHPAPKAALNPSTVIPLGLIVSDPPTQAELQAVATKLDELIAALTRP